MNKRYKITIEEECLEKTIKGRSWEKGCNTENDHDGYGYAPQVEEHKMVNRTIYQQDISELDLNAVIKAINKL
jgi:hypothetical protein